MTTTTKITPASLETDSLLQTAIDAGYEVRISEDLIDSDWEKFLKETPTSRHFQSSAWAQVKTKIGWRSARIIVTEQDQIVAGSQMLIRSIPILGKIAYISRGPVFAKQDPLLMDFYVHWLHQTAKMLQIRFLLIQPPYQGDAFAERLPLQGFQPSFIEVAPTATILVDLTLDVERLHSNLTRRTRQYLRSAENKGISIREGTRDDLPSFYRLLKKTAERNKWSIYQQDYYEYLWDCMSPNQSVRLTLADYKGEEISALLAYGIGEAVYGKTLVRKVDNNLGASDLLVWESLLWSKKAGFNYFDFGRILPKLGAEYVEGERTLGSFKKRAGFFKLRLGGQVAFAPGAYYYIYSYPIRRAFQTIYPRIDGSRTAKSFIKLIRGYRN